MSMTLFEQTNGIKNATSAAKTAELFDGSKANISSLQIQLKAALMREIKELANTAESKDAFSFLSDTRKLVNNVTATNDKTATASTSRPSVFDHNRVAMAPTTSEEITTPRQQM